MNNRGQCARGVAGPSLPPGKVPGIPAARGVAGGWYHSLILLADGTVLAAGDNGDGQLGDGTDDGEPPSPWRSVPQQVPGLDQVVFVAAAYGSSYAVRADGTVYAWGNNGASQLGIGPPSGDVLSPALVAFPE